MKLRQPFDRVSVETVPIPANFFRKMGVKINHSMAG
ncbi:hypothetical protein ALO_14562 [Acetonema longum DSM 6540]|uniref:Uncharacterized protein n=1 Tax=Acetonema longum DSM 6540 TaxID=1009370 RepID=F7NLE0_9FIRM|nr:hypothetical protein ALO_14562 [Acetonema longum DSM 6540]